MKEQGNSSAKLDAVLKCKSAYPQILNPIAVLPNTLDFDGQQGTAGHSKPRQKDVGNNERKETIPWGILSQKS